MDVILSALAEQVDELDGLLSGLDEAGWARPSRCPGWTVSDVVLHLAQTDEFAVASAEGRFGEAVTGFAALAAGVPGASGASVDDVAGLAVTAERGRPGGDVYLRWRRASAAQAAALRACDPATRLTWVAGHLPARTLATTRLAETWIHSGDVAAALGRDLIPSGRLWHIARLAWRTLPYAFARSGRTLSGPVALALTAPDATTWEFRPDGPALTTVTGPAVDFCLVAGRRIEPSATSLTADGPDADAVLDLVRTFA
jgi:uncharacterized protein (TIGR03084 family)